MGRGEPTAWIAFSSSSARIKRLWLSAQETNGFQLLKALALKSAKPTWEAASLRDNGASLLRAGVGTNLNPTPTSAKDFLQSWASPFISVHHTVSLVVEGESLFCTRLLQCSGMCFAGPSLPARLAQWELTSVSCIPQDRQSFFS